MKILRYIVLAISAMCLLSASPSLTASESNIPASIKVAVVNFKTCVDQSKLGKEEQSNFEALRKQMESALEDREKVLNELANKFNDADYLDSLSPETETELKRKFRALSQELNQIQTQYYQTLNQANMKIIQTLHEAVATASKAVAANKNIDLIMSEEGSFFYNKKFDISEDIIAEMNKNYDKKDEEENKS
jgi:outer membrane protein